MEDHNWTKETALHAALNFCSGKDLNEKEVVAVAKEFYEFLKEDTDVQS